MRTRTLPLVVLLTAVAALVVSVGWAFARADGDGWMMSRYGSGMMGLSRGGDGERVNDLAAARRQAQRFADRLDLRVGEMMRFTNNYYAELRERNGRPATEVLVDPANGSVWLEYGPSMMWNTRYGMMSDFRRGGAFGMMGGSGMMGGTETTNGTGKMGRSGMIGGAGMMGGAAMMGSAGMMAGGDSRIAPVQTRNGGITAAEARGIARRWLDRNATAITAGEPEAFPGYYTLHTMRNGDVTGMLSVNASTGAVWFHWWHGRFVSMSE